MSNQICFAKSCQNQFSACKKLYANICFSYYEPELNNSATIVNQVNKSLSSTSGSFCKYDTTCTINTKSKNINMRDFKMVSSVNCINATDQKKLNEKESEKLMVLREILSTESKYLNDLQQIVEVKYICLNLYCFVF